MSAGHDKAWLHVCACGPSEMAGREKHSQSTSLQSKLSILLPRRTPSVMLVSRVSLRRVSPAIHLTLGSKDPQHFDNRLDWKQVLMCERL